MITASRAITVRLSIWGKSLDMINDMQNKIQDDLISVVKHYEKENTDEIHVSLAPDFRCGHCNRKIIDCVCGTPNRSPAV